MYKVYILQSESNPEKVYVGLTIKPINERLREHNEGLSYWTKRYKPWRLIYYEKFYCKNCAEYREGFLKSGMGRKIRDLIVNHFRKID